MANHYGKETKRPPFLSRLQAPRHSFVTFVVATCFLASYATFFHSRVGSHEGEEAHLPPQQLAAISTTTSSSSAAAIATNASALMAVDAQSIKERRDKIYKVLKARDDYLGDQYAYHNTGMGDISTTLISDQIDRYASWAAQPWVRTICEIGFAIGTSTITYLESNPQARVISFDVMEMDGASDKALSFVTELYGSHRIQVIVGPSQETVPSKKGVFGGMCDVISVDGMHDMTALTDLQNFQPLANPLHHVLLADDCVPDEVYEKKKAVNPHVGYFPDVWHSWRQLVEQDVIHQHGYKVHGGEEDPTLESYSGYIKGWCEGYYI